MPNKLLQGSVWNTSGDWVAAGEPVTDDNALVTEVARDIVTGDQGGVDLASLLVPRGYSGSFGSSGAPLQAACSDLRYLARGGFFFESDAGGAAQRTDKILLDAADSAVRAEIGSNAADPGYVDRIICARITALIKGNIAFDTTIKPLVEVLQEASVTIAAAIANPLDRLHNQGGLVKCESVVTYMKMFGGEHTQDTAKIVNGDVVAGTLFYNHQAVSGDATVLRVWNGGILVFDRNSRFKEVTTVELYPGAKMYPSKPDGVSLIITNFNDYRR